MRAAPDVSTVSVLSGGAVTVRNGGGPNGKRMERLGLMLGALLAVLVVVALFYVRFGASIVEAVAILVGLAAVIALMFFVAGRSKKSPDR